MEKYIEQQPFSCGLSLVRNANYQYAYIDESGKVVIPFGLYSWCDPTFVCGFARVIVQRGADYKKWGIIDTLGNIVVPIKYDNIWGLRENHLDKIKAFIPSSSDSCNNVNTSPKLFVTIDSLGAFGGNAHPTAPILLPYCMYNSLELGSIFTSMRFT